MHKETRVNILLLSENEVRERLEKNKVDFIEAIDNQLELEYMKYDMATQRINRARERHRMLKDQIAYWNRTKSAAS